MKKSDVLFMNEITRNLRLTVCVYIPNMAINLKYHALQLQIHRLLVYELQI